MHMRLFIFLLISSTALPYHNGGGGFGVGLGAGLATGLIVGAAASRPREKRVYYVNQQVPQPQIEEFDEDNNFDYED